MIAPEPFYVLRGTPMNVLQMCRVLTRGGYRVDLATYPFGDPVDVPGLTVHRAPRVPGIRKVPIGFSMRKLLLDVPLAMLVTALLLRRRYAVVHAVEEAVFLALPFTWLGVRLVYDLDSLISDQLEYTGVLRNRRLLAGVRALERLALRRASAAVTVCAALTEAARRLAPGTPVHQIEDAPLPDTLREPDPNAVRALRARFGLEGRPVAVYTGNLETYQGIDLLLDAARRVVAELPEASIVLVGGEPDRVGALRARLERDGLARAVLVLGPRPTAEMPEWMALADVLVSPRTLGANTPLKIYSYMHSRTPIVATALPTHTQVLDAGTALLCAPDAGSLARAMVRALRDPASARPLGEAARKRVEGCYGFAAFERKLLAAYDAVLQS